MKQRPIFTAGLAYVFLYILLSSVRDVFLSGFLKKADIFVLILSTFSLTTVFFLVLQAKNFSVFLKALRSNHRDLLGMNLTTAAMWLSFILALKVIEPAIVVSIVSALGPVATLLFSYVLLANFRVSMAKKISALGVLGAVLFLSVSVMSGKTDSAMLGSRELAWGIAFASLSGLSTALNNVFAKRLANRGMKATAIMASRFVGLITIALGVLSWQGWATLPVTDWTGLLFAAVIGMIAPLYFLQLGIQRSDIASVSLVVAVGPLFTFLVQLGRGQKTFSFFSLLGIFMAISFVCVGILNPDPGSSSGVKKNV